MIFPDHVSIGKLKNRLKALGLACGIRQPLTWHVARHSFGTMTLEAGIPMESIAGMMGHSSISSTQIYAQHRSEDFKGYGSVDETGKI